MPFPCLRPAPVLVLVALLCAPGHADSSRSRPGSAPSGSSVEPGAEAGARASGSVGWRRSPAGWVRFGIPWLGSLGPGPAATVVPPGPPDFTARDPSPPAERIAGPPAVLSFDIEPPTASVFLDGVWIGRGESLALPQARLEVRPGAHRLMISDAGRTPATRELELEPGEDRRIEIRLGEADPDRSRPTRRPR